MSDFEQTIVSVKSVLPLIPSEVFVLWLNDQIKQNGWPPTGIEWQGIMLGESLDFWKRLTWSKERVALNATSFTSTSRRAAELLYEASVLKQDNIMSSYIPNTRERFASITAYALKHHALPSTVVLLERSNSYDVIDGNHRIAVLLGLQSVQGHLDVPAITEAEAWIARLP